MCDAISDAASALVPVTAPGRLVVITGIPPGLSQDVVSCAIRAAVSGNGGLYKDDVYVPTCEQAARATAGTTSSPLTPQGAQGPRLSPGGSSSRGGSKSPSPDTDNLPKAGTSTESPCNENLMVTSPVPPENLSDKQIQVQLKLFQIYFTSM